MRQDLVGICQECAHDFPYYLVHNGFNDSSYAYCDNCGLTAFLSAYGHHPSGAPFEPFQKIGPGMEPFLQGCSCGGHFTAVATPRCPTCRTSLSPVAARTWIEANAAGSKVGWRWQLSWEGVYCIVIGGRSVEDPWIAGGAAHKSAEKSTKQYSCPCCGSLTLDEEPPGTYEICPVCGWEDDPVQFDDPDYAGGANTMSLNEAKKAYHEGRKVD